MSCMPVRSSSHPYTRPVRLRAQALRRDDLQGIDGSLPDYGAPPGCRFAPRLPAADRNVQPRARRAPVGPDHRAAYWRLEKELA
jgi:ABC-type dipeptide/oligopeptide/nickel transport system ATPase component